MAYQPKSYRKFLATSVAAAMVATVAAPAAIGAEAADNKFTDVSADAWYAEAVNELAAAGIIDGITVGGALQFQPDREVTRAEAAAFFVKAFDLDEESALQSDFTDVSEGHWAEGAINAVAEKGWFKGSEGKFDPNGSFTREMFVAVLLRALEVEENEDAPHAFSDVEEGKWYTVAINTAAELGYADGIDGKFDLRAATRAEMAGFLFKDNVKVQLPAFQDATELAVESVKAVDVDQVEVKFNKAVDTDEVSFKLKRGAAIYASEVEWNDAKDTATLTTVIKLPASDYTVEIAGLTEEVLVEELTVLDETASSLEVVSTGVAYADNSTIEFKVSNQYGKAMSGAVTHNDLGALSVYNVTEGEALTTDQVANKSEIKLTNIEAKASVGDVLRVTLSYKGFTAQTTVEVIEVAKTDVISLGNIVLEEDQERLTVSDNTVELSYTLLDQFGKEISLTKDANTAADINTNDDVQFTSSDDSVIDGFSTDEDGNLILSIAGDGTAKITAIVNSSGVVSSVDVTVEKDVEPTAVVIAAPTKIVAGGDDAFNLDMTITDQYGTVLESTNDLSVRFKDTLNNATVSFSDYDELTVDLSGATFNETTSVTVEVYETNDSTNVLGTVTFDVEPNAEVSYIKEINFGTVFEVGAEAELTANHIVAIDQYGREISAQGFSVAKDDNTDNTFTSAETATTFVAGAAAGTQEFTVTLGGKTKAIELTIVATADVKSYALEDIDTILASADADYHVTPVLVGKTAAGETVHLVTGKVSSLTTSNSLVAKISSDKVEGVKAGTATVTAWSGATKLASATVTVSEEVSVATSVEFSSTELATTANLNTILVIKDQYGVDISAKGNPTNFANGTVVTADATIIDTNGDVQGIATDEVEVSFITENGLVVTETITLK